MTTTWAGTPRRSIPNYPNYSVTSDGVVHGPKGPLKPNVNSRGYCNVSLVAWAGGLRKVKSHAVHRLVAEAFLGMPTGYMEVNHKDGDKTNNPVSNLEWVTSTANKLHATALGMYPTGTQHHNYTDGRSDRGRVARRATIRQQYSN